MKNIKKEDFELIAKIAGNISRSKRKQQSEKMELSLPDIVGIKLTNRCNLRCKHCYEWNEQGYHHNMSNELQNADIDFEILKKVINETKDTQALFYLWGGEPLVYNRINDLLKLLIAENRYTIICTNATLLPYYYDTICEFGPKIELLLALDGDQKSNDALRGKGNYINVITVINHLIEMRKQGNFKGKISVHTMISNENVFLLQKFVKELDNVGIDDLILCFPWYISESTSKKMDEYFTENFSQFNTGIVNVPSWHAYKYKIEEMNIEKVRQVIRNIREMNTRMNIQFQPDIDNSELIHFLKGDEIYNCDHRECFTIFSRMDLLPSGKVTSCKHFQELVYGDLNRDSVKCIWNSEKANQIRNIIKEKQMPVCSKCNNLYRHSYKPIKK